VTSFGERLHVTIASAADAAPLAAAARAAGLDLAAERAIPASLEDAFIALLARKDAA
jgi:hypothetical protein